MTRIPVIDRVVGDRLRAFERTLPLDTVLRSLAGSGVVTCNGCEITYPPEDPGTVSSILLHGEYEPEVTALVRGVLTPGACFVDLGANIGYFSLLAGTLVQSTGRVYSFEPLPKINRYLAANVERNGLGRIVRVLPCAVSDRTELVSFAYDEHESVAAHITDGAEEANLTVQAYALDDFFAGEGWPRVDLIKMDVEGAELAALRGMRLLSARNADMKLVFEVLYETFARTPERLRELFDTLGELGFTRFTVLHRDGAALDLPRDLERLAALSRRVNLNLLAEKR